MAVFIGATGNNIIKKTTNTDYTIFLGEIVSKYGNVWKVYQKDVTRRKGDYFKYEWRIVRQKDALILPKVGLPNDVSLGDFLVNKQKIKKMIDAK